MLDGRGEKEISSRAEEAMRLAKMVILYSFCLCFFVLKSEGKARTLPVPV